MTTSASPLQPVTVRCAFCGRLNRVDLSRMAEGPRCGECSRPILLDRPVKATGADFDETIRSAAVPVLVDFHADWCGPCRMLAPVIDELASAHAGRLLVLKVDTDRESELARRFDIRGIPTVVVFRMGSEAGRHTGLARRQELERLLGL
ncbi:MAG: thioredoxin [Gemmatimonadales bacterium]